MDIHGKWGSWMLPMNLQMFAEPATEGGEGAQESASNNAEGQENRQNRTYTLEEVTALIQSETDKRVTQALKKQEKQFAKQLSLSGLDEQQRTLAERDQRIADLEESLREATQQKNRLELVKTLAGRDLPAVFADLIEVGEDPDTAQQKIDALDTAFRAAVEEAVNKRLAGKRTPGKGGTTAKTITKEDIMKIRDAAERQAAIRDNMELFE